MTVVRPALVIALLFGAAACAGTHASLRPISAEEARVLGGVRSVRLEVTPRTPLLASVVGGVARRAKRLLLLAGVRIVPDGEASLRIRLAGRLLGASYTVAKSLPGVWIDSGAAVEGDLAFVKAGSASIRGSFRGVLPPPRSRRGRVTDTQWLLEAALKESRLLSLVAEIVGRLHGPAPLVAATSTHEEPTVRIAAVEALGVLEHPTAVPVLGALLHDGQPGMSRRAVAALGRLGPVALPLLLGRLRTVGFGAELVSIVAALERFTGQRFGLDRDAWLRWWAAQPRPPTP